MHQVYILKSLKDGRYYIGEAPDSEEPLEYHNKGWSRYTKSRRPWKIVYTEDYPNRTKALKREKKLKSYKSRDYIEWLIGNKK